MFMMKTWLSGSGSRCQCWSATQYRCCFASLKKIWPAKYSFQL